MIQPIGEQLRNTLGGCLEYLERIYQNICNDGILNYRESALFINFFLSPSSNATAEYVIFRCNEALNSVSNPALQRVIGFVIRFAQEHGDEQGGDILDLITFNMFVILRN